MPTLIKRFLKALLIVLIPLMIMPGSARLLATDAYLAFEYGKASFPLDSYGLDQARRFELASANTRYVRGNLPSQVLSSQTLDGAPAYSTREVTHMADVQAAYQFVWRVFQVSVILFLLGGFALWRAGELVALASAIQSGGLLTLGIIVAIALLAAFAWQVWFDNFHLIFFEPGSWLFAYSDTLIRLFPLQFWIDATFTITALSLAGGLLLAFIGSRWQQALGKRQV